MPFESRLGLFCGLGFFLVIAVFFGPKSSVGPAFINGDSSAPTASPIMARNEPPDAGTHSIWQPQSPRETKPVSRDPLLWP